MSAPNIVNVTTITGKTSGIDLTTGGVDIIENPAASGKVFKINTLIVANIDGTNNADVTVNFVDATGPATRKLANTITVPADASLGVITKDTAIYLEEGDKITGVASADGDLTATVSYEELS
jgi:hypothetical protein